MTRQQLIRLIKEKKSYLCVGLDTDPDKVPEHLQDFKDPAFEFNKEIIQATQNYCVAYKINTAFYEARGAKGWETLEKTAAIIPTSHFRIADAKRGDIGNTSAQYAKTFFETMPFDAVTVAPYMGEDSIRPFLDYPGKWTIVLGLTSNPGARDFELLESGGMAIYERVLQTVSRWGTPENTMFVIGATRAEWFEKVRRLTPQHFYLVPGIGTQGGSLAEVSEKAMNSDGGILVNVSRAIMHASQGVDFASKAAEAAASYQREMIPYAEKISAI
ncbi:MAG: orotidine-5'-phosphate decarboxylase [Bacteroidetes bacterium]|nr:MAG: orotidine-5'-phosphate decarboxylase [Bacteroidota bacterium]